MKSKKKFVIALCSLGVVAVSAVVALVAVIAAFTAKTKSGGFDVTYTAKNVHATVEAGYKVMTSPTDTLTEYTPVEVLNSTATSIVFTGDETDEEVTESFKKIEGIVLKKDEQLMIRYTITNTDTSKATDFKVTVNSTVATSNNLKIEYATSETSTAWTTIPSEVVGTNAVVNGTPLNFYIRISVLSRTQNASFDGTFDFSLVIND